MAAAPKAAAPLVLRQQPVIMVELQPDRPAVLLPLVALLLPVLLLATTARPTTAPTIAPILGLFL